MTDNHPYEQRITGDGDNWGEIMADAFDGLMASASESCTAEELDALESHIAATLGNGECEDVSDRNGVFKCSHCGCEVMEDGVDWGVINFCPDCGKAVER